MEEKNIKYSILPPDLFEIVRSNRVAGRVELFNGPQHI